MAISGKVAVITGASMGIGEAIAKLFADEGAQVVILSRDAGRAEAARARIGHPEQTLALACDVRHREEIDRVVGLTMHHFKRIDIWINNAGHGLLDSIASAKMSDFRELFETNLVRDRRWNAGGDSDHEAAGFGDDRQHFERGRAYSDTVSWKL